MPTNDFKPFATGAGANVMSQADWVALAALATGFQSGKASSAQINKAIRQALFVASALAQYTADKSGQNVLDDGDIAGFVAKMHSAFGADFQPLDATLTAIAALTGTTDKLAYFNGADTAALTDLTSTGRSIIGQNSIANVLLYLGLVDSSGYAGRLIGAPEFFTASGTYTPSTGCKLAVVEMVGGGGGGGGCYLADSSGASAGGGGGSGGYSLLVFSNPVSTAITIGTGGAMGAVAANSSPSNGSTGGDTTFGSLATAKGGRGGLSAGWAVATGSTTTATSDGGGGGAVGTGTYSIAGDSGQRGMQLLTNGSAGYGAPGKLGNGGCYSQGTGSTLILPTKGGGGCGNYRAGGTTYPGTNGADGFCIVWEYY